MYRLYHRNPYAVVVQNLHSTIHHDSIFSDWKAERLPLFYYAIWETHIEISTELTSPCHFQVSKDLLKSDIGNINVKSAFDELFSLGQRTQCSALQWSLLNYYITMPVNELFCVPIQTGLSGIIYVTNNQI
jgi:hypothetical protein